MPNMTFNKHAKQYVVYLSTNSGRKAFYLGKNKKEATTKYHTILLEHNKEISQKNISLMPFTWLVDQFLESDYMQNEIHKFSFNDYTYSLSVFCTMFPKIKCNEIDLNVITKYRRYLLTNKDQGSVHKKKGVSPTRARKHIMYIKRVFNWALETGTLKPSDNTFPKLKKETIPKKTPVFLSEKEIKLLLSYKAPKFSTRKAERNIIRTLSICKFILCSGRRIQEVVNLKKKDFDLESTPAIYQLANHKTSKADPNPKVFVISDELYKQINPIINNISDKDYLFRDNDGNQLKIPALAQCLKKIVSNLSIKNISFRVLRHSFATHMLMCGATLEQIKELLGHSSIKTTEIYAHVTKKYLKEAIDNPKYNELFM